MNPITLQKFLGTLVILRRKSYTVLFRLIDMGHSHKVSK